MKQDNQLSYCGDVVRKHDPDRFFMSLMLPRDARIALWALYAFNYEIAKTREVVTDTTLGLIRLQWWRDGIGEIYEDGNLRQNEILPVLAEAIQKYDLSRKDFDDLCYAREFDLEGAIPANIDGLINYADFTSTPLNRLVLKVLGDDEQPEVIRTISVGYAVSGLLKSVAFHASQQRCYLPADLLAKHNIAERALYDFTAREGLKPIVEFVATQTEASLLSVKPVTKHLRLLRKASIMGLRHLKSCDYDVFLAKTIEKPMFFHLRLFLTF